MIELIGVKKSYGAREVLRGIDFSLSPGEVACLIGRSGSGKSTILRCINGLEKHDAGEILVDGHVVEPAALPTIRRKVAMVFQQACLFPHRTVLENVIEGPVYVLRQDRAEATEFGLSLLAKVGLLDRASEYPSRLSGGEQQRVGIARALAMRPRAVLFDEPTAALDPEKVGEVLQVMRALAEEGMTMLVVTHEIRFAREVADRALFVDGGRIVEDGAARDVLTTPRDERTRLFLNRVLQSP
jgi:polar amino acid transport system ATP-binding protein